MPLAVVTTEPIDSRALAVSDDRAGAVVTFAGVVRNHDGGRGVGRIHYRAHPSAGAVLERLVAEFSAREGVHDVAVVHRIGTVEVGETALAAVVAASHRDQAFSCMTELIDRVKQVLPVWKLQDFTDGSSAWTGLEDFA